MNTFERQESIGMVEIPLSQLNTHTSGMGAPRILKESDFRITYAKGTAERETFDNVLTGVDRSMTLQAFQDTDLFKQYAPEYFLSLTPTVGLTPKRPAYSNVLFPGTITVNREPYIWLASIDHADPNKRAGWQFVNETGAFDQKSSTYARRQAELREFGHAASWSLNLLSDSPLSIMENHMTRMANRLILFQNDWAVATLYEASSGENATAYDNTYQCEGTRTTYVDANGVTQNQTHRASTRDVFKMLHKFRRAEVTTSIDSPQTRGIDYYIPTIIAMDVDLIRDLTLEVWSSGYRITGNDAPSSEVRRTAFLSQYFNVEIVPIRPVKHDNAHSENFQVDDSFYILDTSEWLSTVNHSDGWQQVTWNDNASHKLIVSVRKRQDYLVGDNLTVLRGIPAGS